MRSFLSNIGDFLAKIFRKLSVKKKIKKLISSIETELTDKFLELLLGIIRLDLCLDRDFRKNIEDFNARYAFKSRNGKIAASAIFKNSKMKVRKKEIEDTNITVIFKDGKSLCEFLLSDDPNVFDFILENRLSYVGNVNYMMKFAYMAKHLKLKLGR